ncbi:MAG: energy-coupling factor transporter transmembrane protein EcfT [candidate division KSB1 bacterium]|nr:energy-coupling factor transporter transmembrane protein EcfT [candidate division KSB1 bacterium]MDZ7339909.1 energy-coupling factor transporter transmembrane protein EcfT [candidate division KSB1 bacterium]
MAILNDITLGQYFPVDSFVHRLDPRTKILVILVAMILFVLTNSILKLLLSLVIIFGLIGISHLPLILVLRNLRPFLWLILLTIGLHLFLTDQDVKIVAIPWIGIAVSKTGLLNGALYSARLVILILLATILTLTTSPMEITDALDRFLRPLQKCGVATHDITMMMTLSLRFIPTLIEEADKIQKAQISRGATFEGNFIRRIKSVIPLILPLFISVFRRADELALAMDARCYNGGPGRTSFQSLAFERNDYYFMAAALCLMILFVIF